MNMLSVHIEKKHGLDPHADASTSVSVLAAHKFLFYGVQKRKKDKYRLIFHKE